MLPSAVLVVDPSPVTANRVRDALAGSGLELVIATDQAQADAALRRPDLGVVLVSTWFPGGEGYAFAQAVHTRHGEAVIYLLCGSSDSYDGERAHAAGVEGPIVRPFSVDTVRRHLEAVYGPLADSELPAVEPLPIDVLEDVGDVTEDPPTLEAEAVRTLEGEPLPPVGDERLASFLPRDWRTHPPVRVDPAVVGPAIERAILEVLPEVVEIVLAKAFSSSRSFQDLLEVAVDEAVRAQLPAIARKVIRERLAEIEAAGEDSG
jgi:CheY-like chemotaxis protein